MRKVLTWILIFILLLNTYAFANENQEDLNLNGEAAILIDYDSETILYEKNMHQQLYPASTTKMLTAILAIENGKLDDIVTIDPEIVSLTYGSHIALDYDEEMSVENLLHALLITSANDAALALGKYVSGSIDGFVQMMNEKAKELGAENTQFVNPNGLHDDNHFSSAYDLALIGKYAMENELFREITGKDTYTIPATNKKTEARNLYSTNKFLYGSEKINLNGQTIPISYEGVSGVKTGYTPEAKNCLVTFAERDGRRLLTVVLKADGKEVYADTHKLLNYGFTNFKEHSIAYANEFIDNISIENGEFPKVSAILDRDISYPMNNANLDNIERKIILIDDLKAPIEEGGLLGTVEYYLEDQLIGQGNLISTLSIKSATPTTLLGKILDKWYIFVFALLFITRVIYMINRSRGRRRRRKGKLFGYSPNIR